MSTDEKPSARLVDGMRVYYTGDQANRDGFGVIARAYTNKWGSFVDIDWEPEVDEEEPREPIRGLHRIAFDPGPGCRFFIRDEWEAEREAKFRSLYGEFRKCSGNGQRAPLAALEWTCSTCGQRVGVDQGGVIAEHGRREEPADERPAMVLQSPTSRGGMFAECDLSGRTPKLGDA